LSFPQALPGAAYPGEGGRRLDMATEMREPVPDGVATLSVEIAQLDIGTAVQISGELDFFCCRRLSQVVEDINIDGRRSVVLDLTNLQFCDAGGVRALLRAHRSVGAQGGQLVVRGVSGQPRRVLAITGADQVLDLD
jgi:anti-anti-sigma factor